MVNIKVRPLGTLKEDIISLLNGLVDQDRDICDMRSKLLCIREIFIKYCCFIYSFRLKEGL
jgi:hypothetical protein